jgi:predicted glycosyltransferase
VLRPNDPVIDAYAPPETNGKPLVLATPGGGEDGVAVMEAFVSAAEGADWAAAIISGPLGDPTIRRRLGALAAKRGIAFHRFVPDMRPWLDKASVAVTMGGYNTLVEAASRDVSVVCVPRVRPRREQLIRAQAFGRQGLLRLIHPDELSPAQLGRAIGDALADGNRTIAARARSVLGLDGARMAGRYLLELAAGKVSTTAAS